MNPETEKTPTNEPETVNEKMNDSEDRKSIRSVKSTKSNSQRNNNKKLEDILYNQISDDDDVS